MEVLHIPSGGVEINGVAYLAAGAGPHPTVVLLHGLPGNEKNLDLAQAMRRAGWNVITFNYRGSWGSPGTFSFAQQPRRRQGGAGLSCATRRTRKSLQIDTTHAGARRPQHGRVGDRAHRGAPAGLRGAVLISAADMAPRAGRSRDSVAAMMATDMESLAGTSPEQMADEVMAPLGGLELRHGVRRAGKYADAGRDVRTTASRRRTTRSWLPYARVATGTSPPCTSPPITPTPTSASRWRAR